STPWRTSRGRSPCCAPSARRRAASRTPQRACPNTARFPRSPALSVVGGTVVGNHRSRTRSTTRDVETTRSAHHRGVKDYDGDERRTLPLTTGRQGPEDRAHLHHTRGAPL